LTLRVLHDVHVHQTILSVGGMTEKGLFNSNLLLVETERQMMRCADEVVVVADHTKIGRNALAFLCDWAAVDTLIVDDRLAGGQRAFLDRRANDVRVIVAGAAAETEGSNHEHGGPGAVPGGAAGARGAAGPAGRPRRQR
jgi:DeoR/GlpR family transcriptional regulator of sugar metabolism